VTVKTTDPQGKPSPRTQPAMWKSPLTFCYVRARSPVFRAIRVSRPATTSSITFAYNPVPPITRAAGGMERLEVRGGGSKRDTIVVNTVASLPRTLAEAEASLVREGACSVFTCHAA